MKTSVATIVAGAIEDADLSLIQGDVIGVDYGAFFCADHKIPTMLAIGDFDSVTKDQWITIKSHAKQTLSFPSHKDESDTELALKEAYKLGYNHIIILGVIGSRLDHFYSVLNLLKYEKSVHLVIENTTNRIQRFAIGEHLLQPKHAYLSIFAIEPAQLSIHDVEYPLTNYNLMVEQTIGLSNKATKETIKLSVFSGSVLLIESKDA